MFKKLSRLLLGFVFVSAFAAFPAFALPSGQMVFEYNSFNNITTATTTVVRSGAGLLNSFCVNTVGTSSTLVIYDNTAASGTKVGTWTTTAVGCYPLHAAVLTGITVVTTGSPAADITIYYR